MSSIELPNEVWVEILSPLSYIELKKCERVSKTFQTLILNAPTLASTIFRTQRVLKPGEIAAAKDVKLHPVFELMSYECATDLDAIWFFGKWCDDEPEGPERMFNDTAAAKENATEPPTNVLQLQIHEWAPVKVRGKDGAGVTTKQVMKTLCGIFATRDEDGCSRRDYMGDHTGWTGWDYQRLDGKGRLVLQACCFDS